VPHSPLYGSSLSFRLPLHRSLGKSVRTLSSMAIPESERNENPLKLVELPVLDENCGTESAGHTSLSQPQLVAFTCPKPIDHRITVSFSRPGPTA